MNPFDSTESSYRIFKENSNSSKDLVGLGDLFVFFIRWKYLIIFLSVTGFLIGYLRQQDIFQTHLVLELSKSNHMVMSDPIKINRAINNGFFQKEISSIFIKSFAKYWHEISSSTIPSNFLSLLESDSDKSSKTKPFISSTKKFKSMGGFFSFDIRSSLEDSMYLMDLQIKNDGLGKDLARASVLAFNDFAAAYNQQEFDREAQKRKKKQAQLEAEFQVLAKKSERTLMQIESTIGQLKKNFYEFESKIHSLQRLDVSVDKYNFTFNEQISKNNGEDILSNLDHRALIKRILNLERLGLISEKNSRKYIDEMTELYTKKREAELTYSVETNHFQSVQKQFNAASSELNKVIDGSEFAIPLVEVSNGFLDRNENEFDARSFSRLSWSIGTALVGFILSLACIFLYQAILNYRSKKFKAVVAN